MGARRAIAACCMGAVATVMADSVLIAPSQHRTALRRSKPAMAWCSTRPTGAAREEREEGGRVYAVTALRDGRLELRFGNGAIDFERIRPGDLALAQR